MGRTAKLAASNTNELLKKRIRQLSKADVPDDAKCVVYIMSRDQRVNDNYALLAAQKHANALDLPLMVIFLLYHGAGYRARQHYQFMLEGLKQVGADLVKKNISFEAVDTHADAGKAAEELFKKYKPAAVYLDFSPLHGPRKLKRHITKVAACPCYLVDAHNVVPVWVTSDKQEFAARTIRPKIHKLLDEYLVEPISVAQHTHGKATDTSAYSQLDDIISRIKSNGQTLSWRTGEKAGIKELRSFIAERLKSYADDRNEPVKDMQSNISPYLHFGQVSAQRIAFEVQLAAQTDNTLQDGADAFIEEMIVRRELSDNFCLYNKHYLNLKGAPQWAQDTLAKHADDDREFIYSKSELEKGKTHDQAWNAAQLQLVHHGKMHGYMRMYWAKKVLEWTPSPDEAISILVELNDFYTIDGGDPNGYVGIMWSVAGVHDRPWGERPVYGTVRSMVYNGLKRKFDITAYEKKWTQL